MKFVIITVALVFNFTVVVLYSRGLGGSVPKATRPADGKPVAERSASTPYTPPAAEVSEVAPGEKVDAAAGKSAEIGTAKAVVEPVRSGDGKETLDPKDGKELLPVADEVRPLGLRAPFNRPTTELLPGPRESRGILAPANRANLDPPIVSPEAR